MTAARKREEAHSEEGFSLTPSRSLLALRASLQRILRAPRRGGPLAVAEAAAAQAWGGESILLLPKNSCNIRALRAAVAPTRADEAVAEACLQMIRQPGRQAILSLPKLDRRGLWRRALRFAVEQKLPILFLVSSRHPRRAGDEDLRLLRAEMGVYVIGVDAQDAVALYRAATEAAHHARMGRGPTLLEAIDVRGAQRVDAWEALKAYMTRQGCWKD